MQHHFFIQIWKPIWPPGGHLEFWTSKFVTAISQQLLDGLFPNFVYRFPLVLVVQHHFFIQIWKPIWPPGGHLEFWTSKFVTAISQQLLDGLFPNFVYRFPLGPSCAASLFYSRSENQYGRQAAILNFEHQSLFPLFLSNYWMNCFKFCIQIPLRSLVVQHHFWSQIWKPIWPPYAAILNFEHQSLLPLFLSSICVFCGKQNSFIVGGNELKLHTHIPCGV